MISHVTRFRRLSLALPFLIFASFLTLTAAPQEQTTTPAQSILPGPDPPDAPAEWKSLVGIYGKSAGAQITVFERDGRLFVTAPFLLDGDTTSKPVENYMNREFSFTTGSGHSLKLATFTNSAGEITSLLVVGTPQTQSTGSRSDNRTYQIDRPVHFARADAGSDPAHFYHVSPAQPVAELREKALKLSPPAEPGPFRKPNLMELVTLDSAIHLDIRYASTNNFLSTPVYTQARAFLQRPAAEALLRVLHKLQPLGYGLLIHDAYRPWYVTKIFWDATPPEGKIFVANPEEGSKHNRGCAVDLTLYDLATGKAIEMPGLYDEMSRRSFPTFPGGTSLQRWHRDLLRRAMESEGFTVNQDEWWHFDYKDWKQYGILNVPFEKLGIGQQPADGSH